VDRVLINVKIDERVSRQHDQQLDASEVSRRQSHLHDREFASGEQGTTSHVQHGRLSCNSAHGCIDRSTDVPGSGYDEVLRKTQTNILLFL
jgi:hypothetical protein